jgi:ketosteroid isomerase-like protein
MSAVENEVERFLQGYATAFNRRDMDVILTMYADEAVVVVSGPGGDPEEGFALDKDGLANSLALKRNVWEQDKVRLTDVELMQVSNVAGGVLAQSRWQVQSKPWSGTYESAMFLKMQNGRWRILHEGKPTSQADKE